MDKTCTPKDMKKNKMEVLRIEDGIRNLIVEN